MEVKYAYKVVIGRSRENTLMEELGRNGRMIWKELLKKQIKKLRTELIWLVKGRLLINKVVKQN
jgi:hypothetical protein